MTVKIGVVMDPIDEINPKKDTTLALLLAAQARQWQIFYMEMADLVLRDGVAQSTCREVQLSDSLSDWHEFVSEEKTIKLADLDVIMMRKDPPFDTEYIFATYMLERGNS